MLLADGTDSVGAVLRNTEHADPVVARTDGDHRQQHLRRGYYLLNEQPVDHLVQRAVAADGDDAAIPAPHGLDRQFDGMELMFAEDRLAVDLLLAQQLRDTREVIQPAAVAGHGIDDGEPLMLFDVRRRSDHGYRTGICFNV